MLWVFSISEPVDYLEALRFQETLLGFRVRDEIPNVLLFLEHLPVVTQGRGVQERTKRTKMRYQQYLGGCPVYKIQRGGGLTYHGPGQLVVYAIWKLGKKPQVRGSQKKGRGGVDSTHSAQGLREVSTLSDLLDFLESALDGLFLKNHVVREPKPKARGIWVEGKKVASLGIGVRKWVSFHGLAINVVNDLKPFFDFYPCGFLPEVMTNLKTLLSKEKVFQGAKWRFFLEQFLLSTWLLSWGFEKKHVRYRVLKGGSAGGSIEQVQELLTGGGVFSERT